MESTNTTKRNRRCPECDGNSWSVMFCPDCNGWYWQCRGDGTEGCNYHEGTEITGKRWDKIPERVIVEG